jgi:TldD protein
MMKRRDFVKLTATGSIIALGAPALLDLVARDKLAAADVLPPELKGVLKAALANGGQFADVYLEQVDRTTVSLAGGKVESVECGIHRGGGVRLLSDWKTGYSSCDSWEEEELKRVAGVASQMARGGGEPEIEDFTRKGERGIVAYEISPDEIESARKVEIATHADTIARAYDPAIKQVRVNYTDEIKRIVVANSDGVMVTHEVPLVWITVSTLAQRDSKQQSGYIRRSAKRGFEYAGLAFAEEAARESARQAVDMLEAGEAPGGEIPVVIGSGGGVVFHEAVGHGLEADGVERKTSFYTGMVGTRVGSDLISIIDDGSIPNLRGSFDYDDEGTPSQENVLIENGILKGYIYDLLTAWKLKAKPTGNGRRQSYMHYPMVRMTNTHLLPGDSKPEEIIEATPNGIFTRHLGGGEVDTTTGDFTFGVREAYLIENGKIGAPVKGATLIGNGPEILKRIDMVGDDVDFWPGTCGKGQWVPVTSGAPTLRIASITVGGRG